MDIDDALSELEAVGIGHTTTTTTTTSGTIAIDPNYPTSTGTGQIFIGGTNNDITFDNDPWTTDIGSGRATLQMGALTLSPQENGDVEIVMEADGLREEYHINADKVRNFLRGIADVVVEGKET